MSSNSLAHIHEAAGRLHSTPEKVLLTYFDRDYALLTAMVMGGRMTSVPILIDDMLQSLALFRQIVNERQETTEAVENEMKKTLDWEED